MASILRTLIFFLVLSVIHNGIASAMPENNETATVKTSAAKKKKRKTKRVDYCQGGRFKPCVCWEDVPRKVRYKPSDDRCPLSTYPGDQKNHVASIVLSGDYYNAFSAVVRDGENADRSPCEPSLCSLAECELGLSKCSRWKVQSGFRANDQRGLCLGASGFSEVFEGIRRITVKLKNIPGTADEPYIRRLCLRAPDKVLNYREPK